MLKVKVIGICPVLSLTLALLVTAPAFTAADPSLSTDQPAGQPSESGQSGEARQAERANLVKELQKLEEQLPVMEEELTRLRRNWTLSKGRAPSPKEIEEYQKKLAKGEATDKDNPYIRRTPSKEEIDAYEKKLAKGPVSDKDNPYIIQGPFGMSGRDRQAYYRKKEDLERLRERIAEVRKQIGALRP